MGFYSSLSSGWANRNAYYINLNQALFDPYLFLASTGMKLFFDNVQEQTGKPRYKVYVGQFTQVESIGRTGIPRYKVKVGQLYLGVKYMKDKNMLFKQTITSCILSRNFFNPIYLLTEQLCRLYTSAGFTLGLLGIPLKRSS